MWMQFIASTSLLSWLGSGNIIATITLRTIPICPKFAWLQEGLDHQNN